MFKLFTRFMRKEPVMRDRAERRHQEFKVKRKLTKQYNSCIEDLPSDTRQELEGNVDKLKKVCASPFSEDHDQKAGKKTIQELKHDITMKEQLE